jgi:hypothetical protein
MGKVLWYEVRRIAFVRSLFLCQELAGSQVTRRE